MKFLDPTRKMLRRWYWRNAPKTSPVGTTVNVQGVEVPLPNRAARRRHAAEARRAVGWRTYAFRADD